jgi:tyrosinase
MTIHLGPFTVQVRPPYKRNPQANGMGNNARCLRRDMNNDLAMHQGRPEDIAELIESPTLNAFQSFLEGVHGVGHFTIAGDPGGDVFNSPGDPAFWVHHGMIDRIWSIWQSQDIENRTYVVAGMGMNGNFTYGPQSLDEVIDLGVVADKALKIRDLASTVDGPFCYTYE